MKIRTGFVSNSSTSSFLIYGSVVSIDKLKHTLEVKVKGEELSVEHMKSILKNEDLNFYMWDYYQLAEFAIKKFLPNFEYHSGPYDNSTIYLGRSWDSIQDDETGKQFKDSINNNLKELFGNEITVKTFEES